MKYIRTKDGRIIENNWCSIMDAPASLYNNILNQSDNLDDLLDCHVIIINNHPIVLEKGQKYTFHGARMSGKTQALKSIYGSIWVGLNLKTVAKLGEKGWELL